MREPFGEQYLRNLTFIRQTDGTYKYNLSSNMQINMQSLYISKCGLTLYLKLPRSSIISSNFGVNAHCPKNCGINLSYSASFYLTKYRKILKDQFYDKVFVDVSKIFERY